MSLALVRATTELVIHNTLQAACRFSNEYAIMLFSSSKRPHLAGSSQHCSLSSFSDVSQVHNNSWFSCFRTWSTNHCDIQSSNQNFLSARPVLTVKLLSHSKALNSLQSAGKKFGGYKNQAVRDAHASQNKISGSISLAHITSGATTSVFPQNLVFFHII